MSKDFKIENWKAYYINLDLRKDRRDSIKKELINQGISAERFAALTDEDVKKFPEFKPGNFWVGAPHSSEKSVRLPRTPGEWGCALSHYLLIKKYLDSGDSKILAIFEDDALFCKDFEKRLEYLEKNFYLEWDVFYLNSFCPLLQNKKTGMKNVYKIEDVIYGTHAMLLNPKSLPKILELIRKFAPSASAIDSIYCHINPYLNVYCFVPGMVTQKSGAGNIGKLTDTTKFFYQTYGPHIFSETLEDFDFKKTNKIYLNWFTAEKIFFSFLGKMGIMYRKIKKTLDLAIVLAKAEFKLKNEGSYLGILWYLLNPILTFALLFLVFNDRLGSGIKNYPLYLLLGIIMFNFFQTASLESLRSIIWENHFLIKSINFPRESLVFSIVFKNLFSHFFEIILFFGALIFFHLNPFLILYYIPILLMFMLFISGACLFLACLTVYFVDLDSIWNFGVRLLWLATPIFYAIGGQTKLFYLNLINPIFYFISLARDLIIYNKAEPLFLWGSVAWSIIAFCVGFFAFSRLKNKFAELV
jgi:ABC-type polysaccharide/polyol phosphate export permease/GR25 family glycosyltransferase involved in LPS biosynthesis